MQKYRTHLMIVAVAAVVCAVAVAFIRPAPSGAVAGSGPARKVVSYQDSMHPWIKSDHAGRCTICDMALTPIYEGDKGFSGGDGIVSLSSNSITVLNVQTEEVRRQSLVRTIRVAGTLEADDSRKSIFSAPAPGRVISLDVGSVGAEVEEGQRMIRFFSPELAAKRQYGVRPTHPAHDNTNEMAMGRAPKDANLGNIYSIDLAAPQSGTVVERNVFAGQYVTEGEKLLTIVDSSVLWFRFDAYEGQLSWLEPGQGLKISIPSLPGRNIQARISLIEPAVNDVTRTAKVRAEVPNPLMESEGRTWHLLRLGMYAEGRIAVEIPGVLVVPRNAILFPGRTAYAYVQRGDGAYERRRVKLGHQGDDVCEVLSGLKEGDRVVTAGNVLIDAQAQFTLPADAEDSIETHPVGHLAATESTQAPRNVMKQGAAVKEKMEAPSAAAPPHQPVMARLTPKAMPAEGTEKKQAPTAPSWMGKTIPPEQQLGDDGQPLLPATRSASGAGRSAAISRMIEARMTKQQAMMIAGQEMRATAAARIDAGLPEDAAAPVSAPVLKQSLQTPAAGKAMQGFVTSIDRIGDALASDSLEQFNQRVAELPGLITALRAEVPAGDALLPQITKAIEAAGLKPAKDLKDARAQFLPFSTAAFELAKSLRKQGGGFASIKTFHCPMAPEPGLWVQTSPQIKNPYFGSKMLKCGEEVRP